MTSPQITFTVHAVPVPQGSMRRGTHGGVYHSNPNLGTYREHVRIKALNAARKAGWQLPVTCAVAISETYRLPKPKTTKYADAPAGKPDLDKLERAVGDALAPRKRPGLLADDSHIIMRSSLKTWAKNTEDIGVTIRVTLIDPDSKPLTVTPQK